MSFGRPWNYAETAKLVEMADEGRCAKDISRAIGRTPDAIYKQTQKLCVNLRGNAKLYSPATSDRSMWDEADRLCAFANVPLPLARLVVEVCHKRNLEVSAVRREARSPEYIVCRREIARRARAMGFSYPDIGRAMNRDHTTVRHHVTRV